MGIQQPFIIVSLLQELFNLEPYLEEIGVEAPPGIYVKNKFNPILTNTDKEGCYVVDEKGQENFYYYDQIEKHFQHFKERRLSILNEDGVKLTKDTRDMSLTPILPVRAQRFVKLAFICLVEETRRWNYKDENDRPGCVMCSAMEKALYHHSKYVRMIWDQEPDKVEDIAYTMIEKMNGYFEDVYEKILKKKWEILSVSAVNDLFTIYAMGDYRIEQYMDTHNRRDY